MSRVPYEAYADEVRRVLDAAVAPRRIRFLSRPTRSTVSSSCSAQFGDRVIALDDAPRVHPHQQAVHLDRTLPVSNYQKGKSALVDCLVLAATSYLVKGRSNLSDASLAFNPELPYSFCPDVAALLHASGLHGARVRWSNEPRGTSDILSPRRLAHSTVCAHQSRTPSIPCRTPKVRASAREGATELRALASSFDALS